MQSEQQLIQKFISGDQLAFGELYDLYVEKIYNFIYYRTLHKETAEDLTSLVFTKVLENIDSFNAEKGRFSTWLYQIARNTVIDHYRAFKPSEDIENAFDLASNSNVERDADVRLSLEKVEKYLKELPKEAREIIIMRVWDGLSYKEISAITGKSEASLKMLFSRSVTKLQQTVPVSLFILLIPYLYNL
jgi:RNA polymerase sigma factor (sigma-70 family)